MAITNTRIDAVDKVVYTSPGNSAITALYLINNGGTATDRTVSVFVVPSAGSVNDITQIYKDLDIPVSDTYLLDSERLILDAGDTIVCRADVLDEVSCTISSMDI